MILSFFLGTILLLGFFKCLLGSDLVQSSCSILLALLQLSQPLHFTLFLFLDALLLTCVRLFSLNCSALVGRNLVIQIFFGHTGLLFLFKSVFVCNLNFLVPYLNSHLLLFLDLDFFLTGFLNIVHEGGFLHLADLFLALAHLLTRSNLIDQNLGTTFASLGRSNFSIMLSLDGLKSFNFHHHIKSLLLFHPILLEVFVFNDLAISHSANFRG